MPKLTIQELFEKYFKFKLVAAENEEQVINAISSALKRVSLKSEEDNDGDELSETSSEWSQDNENDELIQKKIRNIMKLIKKNYDNTEHEKIVDLIQTSELKIPLFSKVKRNFYSMNKIYKIFPCSRFNERDEKFYELFCFFYIVFEKIESNIDRYSLPIAAYAYKVLVCFGDRVSPLEAFVSYIKKYRDRSGNFIHKTLSSFLLPEYDVYPIYSKRMPSKLSEWRRLFNLKPNFVFKNFKHANKIEKVLSRVPATIEELKNALIKISYANSEKNPQLAAICNEYNIEEETFNQCLAIKVRDSNNLPNVIFSGECVGYPRYYIVKLSNDDPHAFFLGKMSDCCQSIGGLGEYVVKDGLTLENNGFYVLLHRRSYSVGEPILTSGRINYEDFEIVGQSYAWRGKTDGLVFDSWERKRPSDEPVILAMLPQFAQTIIAADKRLSRVLVGQDGMRLFAYNKFASEPEEFPEEMIEGDNSGDAEHQFCLSRNKAWIEDLKLSFSKGKCFVSDKILNKALELIFDMEHHPDLIKRLFFRNEKVWCLISEDNPEVKKKVEKILKYEDDFDDYLLGENHAKLIFYYDILEQNHILVPELMRLISGTRYRIVRNIFELIYKFPKGKIDYAIEILKTIIYLNLEDDEEKDEILVKLAHLFCIYDFLIVNEGYFGENIQEIRSKICSIILGDKEFRNCITSSSRVFIEFLSEIIVEDKNKVLTLSFWLSLIDEIYRNINSLSNVKGLLGRGIVSSLIKLFFPEKKEKIFQCCVFLFKNQTLVSDFRDILGMESRDILETFLDFSEKIHSLKLCKFIKYYVDICNLKLIQAKAELLLSIFDDVTNPLSASRFLLGIKCYNAQILNNSIFENLSLVAKCEKNDPFLFQNLLECLGKRIRLRDAILDRMLTPEYFKELFSTQKENSASRISILLYLDRYHVLSEYILDHILKGNLEFLLRLDMKYFCCVVYSPELLTGLIFCDSLEKESALLTEIKIIYQIFEGIDSSYSNCKNFLKHAIDFLYRANDIRQNYAIFIHLLFEWDKYFYSSSSEASGCNVPRIFRKGIADLLDLFKEKNLGNIPPPLMRSLGRINPDISIESSQEMKLARGR